MGYKLKVKPVLEMTCLEAHEFLLESENYARFQIPEYFNFQNIINKVDGIMMGKDLKSFLSNKNGKANYPSQFENVNYKFIDNKDGKYSYRPFQLIHPVLYVGLVQLLTSENNWSQIQNRFKKLHKHKHIECISMPIKSSTVTISDHKATILNWWSNIEQRSIELSLTYDYVIHTDVSNCYSNIYTHSVAWAIEGRSTAKRIRDKSLLGNKVDKLLQSMSYGQTNGIPQGSVLMDLIAELVLGYADLLLGKKTKQHRGKFKILRYRDDYRIFTNSPVIAEKIMKNLTDVLSDIGLSLGASKTTLSRDVIRSSIKKDKLYWNNSVKYRFSFQKQLLLINEMSHNFPNSGQLSVALEKFYKRLQKFRKHFKDTHALIGIVVDIAYRNPRVYPITTAIISVLIKHLQKKEQKKLLKKIVRKFKKLPNTGHLMIWLQRIFIGTSPNQVFDEKLCEIVMDSDQCLWYSEWLNGNLYKVMKSTSIIDHDVLSNLDQEISIELVKDQGYDATSDFSKAIIL